MSIGIFEKKYNGLNAAQKQAVDQVDGPVMVIAGPGTGKTELLSVRVANILKQTDALAENILCLTFTESGAVSMRERLANLMGKDAYRVAVYTFHGFGSEVIGRHSDFFYSGAHFRPADELSTHQILTDIFATLPHTNPLASQMNGEYSYLKNVQHTISDFKKSGLTPDEIQRLLRHNQGFLEYSEPILAEFFALPMHKSMLDKLDGLYNKLANYQSMPTQVPNTEPLNDIFLSQLEQAIDMAKAQQKVTAITAWRNLWLEKNKKNQFVFKDTARTKKLLAASLIYSEYLNAMQAAMLYDYDDMILRLVHALEVFPDLKFNLQEQYQYILVDEFQDTNGAQMRILLSLADNPVVNGKPNILVVGDDDQAIYSFQGAELSNLLSFQKQFKPSIISLRENYRSAPIVLEHARAVIILSSQRLETVLKKVDKTPVPIKKNDHALVRLVETISPPAEYDYLAKTIAKQIKAGQKPGSIAVLCRNHADIQKLLPYFSYHGIAFSYEHQENILELAPIKILARLARIVVWLSESSMDKVDAFLPELLSHPAWEISSPELWQLSLTAYKDRLTWLEAMQQSEGSLKAIANFIIATAYSLEHRSLEQNIDRLYGFENATETGEYISPIANYYFGQATIPKNPHQLIENIRALEALRQRLRDYKPDKNLSLKDFTEFIDSINAARIRLTLQSDAEIDENAIAIMTAHKAKGREFESVYVVNAVDERWGSKSRGRSSHLSYPENLPIGPPGSTEDERLRLFFVAMTRAKRELVISYATHSETGKPNLRADFLQSEAWGKSTRRVPAASLQEQREIAEVSWQDSIIQPQSDLKSALKPHLKTYQLSVTHMNSFLNVSRGGPKNFLIHNLLRFPRSLSPQEALGSAVHSTLKHAHDHFAASGERRPIEDILYDFEKSLGSLRLAKNDFAHQLQKGSDLLQAYLSQRYDRFSPSQVGERNFHRQGIVVEKARITGIIDVMTIDKSAKTISVIDYKTGSPCSSWQGKSDYEKTKLHQYKQQLLFYKLLIEASPDYRDYTVSNAVLEFIEPNEHGEIVSLKLDYADEDITTFRKLIGAVWQRIMQVDFVNTTGYPQTFKGMLAFEEHLLKQ